MTGEELWKVRHNGFSIVPRPVYGHGLVFVVTDHDHPELWAVRPDGTGDVTGLIRNDKQKPTSWAPLKMIGGQGNMIVNNLLGGAPELGQETGHSSGNVVQQ